MDERKILIIDDQPINIEQIVNFLEETGESYRLFQAIDGEMGCEVAEKIVPDLIITDWEMPVMSGIEAVKRIKSRKATKDIPIIMSSGVMTTSENLKTALEAGAVDYIRKPIDKIELIARVRSILLLADSYVEIRHQRDELGEKNRDLKIAIDKVKTLNGLLPICSSCKKIRDDKGYWNEVETYVKEHSDAEFSHGICPECVKELYPDIYEQMYGNSRTSTSHTH
ncbi:MAG: response regulator [candidate division Zixibacteria bacterium]|nr:response regulator [candidate division Zixibacteria bacterium]